MVLRDTMLSLFRQQQGKLLGTLASYSMMLLMLFKLMMPVAHAATALSGKPSGIFATVCSASNVGQAQVVRTQIEIPLDFGQPEKPQQAQTNDASQCPLCFIVDLSGLDQYHAAIPHHFQQNTAVYSALDAPAVRTAYDAQFAIRAPPRV